MRISLPASTRMRVRKRYANDYLLLSPTLSLFFTLSFPSPLSLTLFHPFSSSTISLSLTFSLIYPSTFLYPSFLSPPPFPLPSLQLCLSPISSSVSITLSPYLLFPLFLSSSPLSPALCLALSRLNRPTPCRPYTATVSSAAATASSCTPVCTASTSAAAARTSPATCVPRNTTLHWNYRMAPCIAMPAVTSSMMRAVATMRSSIANWRQRICRRVSVGSPGYRLQRRRTFCWPTPDVGWCGPIRQLDCVVCSIWALLAL